MSYARFGWNGSDVYVFLHAGGFIQCCGCPYANDGYGSFNAYRTKQMVDHLKKHQANGDHVPEKVFTRLEAEHEENMAFIREENFKQMRTLMEGIEDD